MTSDPERAKALRAREDAVARLQSMESLVRLTAGTGHEFNNLIQTVVGALQLVQRLIVAGRFSETDRFIESALQAARSASEINQQLVRLARPQPLDPKPLAMNEVITGLARMLRCALPRSVTLGTDLASGLWSTHCDHHGAEIALLNLVLSVLDTMPGDGTITVSTGNRELDRDGLSSIELPPGNYVVVEATGDAQGKEIGLRTTSLAIRDVVRRFAADNGGGAAFDAGAGRSLTAVLFLPRFEGAATDGGEIP
jgi:signal transduction histidine kinase